MGLKVTTDDKPVKVIRKDRENYTFYSLMVSSKTMDGEFVNGFIDCQFKKGVDIPNKTKIYIKNAFYSVSAGKDGRTYTKIFVLDYELAEGESAPENVSDGGFLNIPDGIDEDLPFN